MRKQISVVIFFLVLFTFGAFSAAAQGGRKSVSAAEVNGTYKMNFTGKFRRQSNDMKILALGRGKIRVAFDLLYPYSMPNGEISANMGSIEGEAAIEGDKAVFRSDEFGPCRITIRFLSPGSVKVVQEGTDFDCGFGHNVWATGTYRKVSSKKPTFDE